MLHLFSTTILRSEIILNSESSLHQVKCVVVVPIYTSTALHLHLYNEEPSCACEIYSRAYGTSGVRYMLAHLIKGNVI